MNTQLKNIFLKFNSFFRVDAWPQILSSGIFQQCAVLMPACLPEYGANGMEGRRHVAGSEEGRKLFRDTPSHRCISVQSGADALEGTRLSWWQWAAKV